MLALDAWLSAYVSSGGNFYQNSALAAAGLLPSPFLSHQQLLSPQILGAGALQNGALAAAAAAAGVGTIPGMLGGAARLPVIPSKCRYCVISMQVTKGIGGFRNYVVAF